jgi:hypothetical protein
LNPFTTAQSFVAALQGSTSFQGWTPENPDHIDVAFSVGSGRGSAKVELTAESLPTVREYLADWEPEDLSALSPLECIQRTINRDDDGNVTFKTSLAKNSRSVKIPAASWDDFLGYLTDLEGHVEGAVEHYKSIQASANDPAE